MSNSVLMNLIRKLDNCNCSDYYGLKNQGATCYLNSVLQVLFMTKDFREAVERHCGHDSSTIDPHLTRLFKDLERGTADTRHITKKLGIVQINEERDAAEYFERILNLLSPEASQIFKGRLRHRTTCLGCRKQSDTEDPFWTLPLTMEHHCRNANSLGNCFEAFFEPSEVSGDNKLYCDQCDGKTDATIDCEIKHHPEILTLLLKRFEFDRGRMHYVKNNSCVDVPETLQTTNGTYDLYALVNHFGSLTGGHVTATIKSYETGEWYNFNDTHVRRVKPSLFEASNNKTKSSNVYLLMYRKATVPTRSHNYQLSGPKHFGVSIAPGSKIMNGAVQEPHLEKPDGEGIDKEDVDEEDVAENGHDRIARRRHHHLRDDGDYATKRPKRNKSKERRDDTEAGKGRRGESIKRDPFVGTGKSQGKGKKAEQTRVKDVRPAWK